MAEPPTPAERVATFERHRARLFGIAYRMLGSVEDGEDAVQETYLRWHASAPQRVLSAEAWLVAVVTRISIDRLRRAATERATYQGNWLPEPIAMTPALPTDSSAEVASDMSMAFLVLLERLAPEERAAFLLREVFDTDYAEIARVLEKSEAASRQIVHRARERVRRGTPRVAVPPDAKERLIGRFITALAAEDKAALISLFSDDVVWVSDGGGKAPAVRELVRGAERVAQLAVGFERMGRGLITHRVTSINGEAAVLTLADELTLFTTSFAIDGDRITAVYRVLNPDKLHRVGPPPRLGGGAGSAQSARSLRQGTTEAGDT